MGEDVEERENGDCHYDACFTLMRNTITVDLLAIAAILLLAILVLWLRICFRSCCKSDT